MGSKNARARSERVAYAYARVSTSEQAEGMSVDAQFRALRTFAGQRGTTIAREFADRGASGVDDQRPEFRRMLEGVLSPASDVGTILVVHTSRFMRDVELARRYKREFRRLGVRVVAIQQEVSDDANGELMEGVYELFDQHESRIIGMRTRVAMAENARQGFFNGTVPPFGFAAEPVTLPTGKRKRRLVRDGAEAELVRELFEQYLSGLGAKALADRLNERGTSYRGRPWSRDLVLRVLEDPVAAGDYRWGRREGRTGRRRDLHEQAAAKLEELISRELFDAVQSARRQRDPLNGEARYRPTTQLLGGLLRCGLCQHGYQLETSGKRDPSGAVRRYYQCRTFCRSGKQACRGFRIKAATLDRAVLDHLLEQVTGSRIRDALAAYRESVAERAEQSAAERAELERAAADLDSRITRWVEAFEVGGDLQELSTERLALLRADRAALQRRLGELPQVRLPPFLFQAGAAERLQAYLSQTFASNERHAIRSCLDSFVDRLELTQGEVVVHYDLDGLVALLAEKGRKGSLRTTASEVRTDVYRWRARRDSNP